jgi:hypothetical protein
MGHDQEPRELRLDNYGNADPSEFTDAVEGAASQDQETWITDADGRRVAAIVPVDVREYHDAMIAGVLGTPVAAGTGNGSAAGRHRRAGD